MQIYGKYFSNEFKKYYIEDMKDSIGLIDFKALDSRNFEVLYYLFPLIEKLFIEVLKYNIDSDIELYNQGTYRTLESALEKSENHKFFNEDLIRVIHFFYNKGGLRNKLFHYTGATINITTFDILATKCIALQLLKTYKNKIEESNNNYNNDKIELLK